MKKLSYSFAAILLLLCASAFAQHRGFPADAPRGYLTYKDSQVLLNDKPVALTPGVQIRDENNRIIFPQMIEPDSIVKYKLEGKRLHRAWIMTPYEIKLPDKEKNKLPARILPLAD